MRDSRGREMCACMAGGCFSAPSIPLTFSMLCSLLFLQRQAGRFASFLTGGKPRQGVCAARGEVKSKEEASKQLAGRICFGVAVYMCLYKKQSVP